MERAKLNRPRPAHFLHTERLSLHPLTDDDAPGLHRIWTKEAVRRFLWDGAIVPPSRTLRIIAASRDMFAAKGYGLWGVRRLDEEELIGFGGFWLFRDPPELEILFGVTDPLWGRGYATELAGAVARYGIRTLGMEQIRASTDVGNSASIRVLEKLGFRHVKTAPVDGLDTAFYVLEGATV
jgi:ribosomal-protein-alanine N-acetyltransferase